MSILLDHPVRCLAIAIALQTAGALLLIVNVWGKTRKRIIDMYFPKYVFANKKTSSIIMLDRDEVRNCALNLYLNRIAFIYIAIGYFLGIYGEIKNCSKENLSIAVIFGSMILVVVGYFWAKGVSKLLYREDLPIDIEEVPKGVEILPTDEEWEEEIGNIFEENNK